MSRPGGAGERLGAPEVLLRRERVVRVAVHGQILGAVRTALSEGLSVMKLESMRLRATAAECIDVRAARTIALEHGTGC